MNDESIERANKFLAALVERVAPGELLEQTPAEIGREMGFDPLTTARAVRALLGRNRIDHVQNTYRLLDTNPIAPDERREFRPKRKRKRRPPPVTSRPQDGDNPSYATLGRESVSMLLELSREAERLRATLEVASDEVKAAKERQQEAEQRAGSAAEKVHDLEIRAEMAEANLRSVLVAMKTSGTKTPEAGPVDEALLAYLRGE
jgi:DNA-binding protein H-NS